MSLLSKEPQALNAAMEDTKPQSSDTRIQQVKQFGREGKDGTVTIQQAKHRPRMAYIHLSDAARIVLALNEVCSEKGEGMVSRSSWLRARRSLILSVLHAGTQPDL